MIISLKCPSCGADMDVDISRAAMFCPYCGTKVANVKEQADVTHTGTLNINHGGTINVKRDLSNEPNLYVTYMSNESGLSAGIRIDRNPFEPLVAGMSKVYRLSPGPHIIICKFGRKSYKRDIFINAKNETVRVDMVFNGRSHININQPLMSAEEAMVVLPANDIQSSIENSRPRERGWWGRNWPLVIAAHPACCLLPFIMSICIGPLWKEDIIAIVYLLALTIPFVIIYFARKAAYKKTKSTIAKTKEQPTDAK